MTLNIAPSIVCAYPHVTIIHVYQSSMCTNHPCVPIIHVYQSSDKCHQLKSPRVGLLVCLKLCVSTGLTAGTCKPDTVSGIPENTVAKNISFNQRGSMCKLWLYNLSIIISVCLYLHRMSMRKCQVQVFRDVFNITKQC